MVPSVISLKSMLVPVTRTEVVRLRAYYLDSKRDGQQIKTSGT